jgi:hypothetical protein
MIASELGNTSSDDRVFRKLSKKGVQEGLSLQTTVWLDQRQAVAVLRARNVINYRMAKASACSGFTQDAN